MKNFWKKRLPAILLARIIAREQNVTLIRLPVEAEENDPLGRRIGEALCPELGKDNAWLKQFKESYLNDISHGGGHRAWQALYQCSPRVEGGNLVRREWWRFFNPKDITVFGTTIISVDATFKDGKDNDYVAIEKVRDYCERRGYSTEYYILVDFSIPSGKKRFFIYDLQSVQRVASSYCMHGSGQGNTDAKPKSSNEFGSGCSSLGRYIMVGKGTKFKSCIRLRGLDKSNSLAEMRGILIHSAGKVTRFHGETEYIPIGTESEGCFTVSRDCVSKVMEIYKGSTKKRPVILFAKYEK